MTKAEFERAANLKDEIDRYFEEAQELHNALHITLKVEHTDSETYITIEDKLLETIELWYDKKIGALEAEFKEL